jgi:hypothetical protein
MRIFKPTTAAIAAAALALAPAGAYAVRGAGRHAGRRTASPSEGCRLSVNAAPRYVENGESAEVFGQLSCNGRTSAGNQTVTVMERPARSAAATSAGTATTDAAGHYELTSPALTVNTSFYTTALGAKSDTKTVRVSPKVTLGGPPEGAELFTGKGPLLRSSHRAAYRNTVTFAGSVSPADAGALVALQREQANSGELWHRIGTGTVAAGGGFTIVHTFSVPGDASIRVVVRPGRRGLNGPGVSETISYEISQAQNPALTILSSAEPISYGQPVTISGTVAGGAGTALTLLQRLRGEKNFVAVAKTTSTSGGAYAFAAQTPSQSVFYRVMGAGRTSAVAFEGVKYGLAALPPASTAQAGQPLTFAGTVTPAQPGHVVYLQIANPSGIGMHTVQVGTENSTGAFSIVHSQYVPGVKQFRIKVPGEPEYESIAGSPFTVNVTSAAPGALTPELPGNSSLPSEGQI